MARLDELERKFEENPRRYFAPLANEYRKAGDAQRAVDLCRAQLPELPGHISGHIVLGQALYDSGDFPGSRATLETALALDPENIVALRYLGDIARETGDIEGAERWYTRTVEADPYNEAATVALQSLRETTPLVTQNAQPPTPDADETQTTDVEPFTPTAPEVDAPSEPLLVTDAAPATGFEPTAYEPEQPPTEPADQAAESEPLPDDVVQADPSPAAESELLPDDAVQADPSPADVEPEPAEFAGDLEISAAESTEPAAQEPELPAATEPEAVVEEVAEATPERFDVEAHADAEPSVAEETLDTEEGVLEAAAPFVTETMADLYLEQGYPHEALELLLQLAEQRPGDEPLRAKIEQIEAVIVARRDAAVASARAERAEAAEPRADPPADSPAEPPPAEPSSIRDMFARMDKVRPRPPGASTPKPLSRLRSDFTPMPKGEDAGDSDPFAFPNTETPPGTGSGVPRSSGPQPRFNPSTAEIDEFDAWLRGLRGP
ncbi:hypothetical protein BH23GEM1_BH23GEM1_04100 [soil metagenome]